MSSESVCGVGSQADASTSARPSGSVTPGVDETQQQVEGVLRELAQAAVRGVVGADEAGLSVSTGARTAVRLGTTDAVRAVEDLQDRLREGPSVTAAFEGTVCSSDALGVDARWPVLGPQAAELGAVSALALPLAADGRVLGTLTLYAGRRDAFDAAAAESGERIAATVVVAAASAMAYAHSQSIVSQLEHALTSRATIDQAKGIVMARFGCDPDQAFAQLVQISQTSNTKLAEVAQRLVASVQHEGRPASVTARPEVRPGVERPRPTPGPRPGPPRSTGQGGRA